eukprot:TRINITY_DN24783_c0_g1_i1.p1 TRINITY_DN24783_c0_g1~~TRINITY_DN24783_c0_g1_i1.p1  ORF type:complete len:229 (-),score=57.30 TRINITY_DN24783_c0_g1_i1:82-768(-)
MSSDNNNEEVVEQVVEEDVDKVEEDQKNDDDVENVNDKIETDETNEVDREDAEDSSTNVPENPQEEKKRKRNSTSNSNKANKRSKTRTSYKEGATARLVATGFEEHERRQITTMVEELGGDILWDQDVTDQTTHVLCGRETSSRTLKVLQGIAQGCWVVKKAWLTESLKEKKYIEKMLRTPLRSYLKIRKMIRNVFVILGLTPIKLTTDPKHENPTKNEPRHAWSPQV